IEAFWPTCALLAGCSLPRLPHLAVMNQASAIPAVSVVVPVFNEEENVSILQSELRAALSGLDYEIVFVDDGSTDRSAEKIETAPNIRILRFEKIGRASYRERAVV